MGERKHLFFRGGNPLGDDQPRRAGWPPFPQGPFWHHGIGDTSQLQNFIDYSCVYAILPDVIEFIEEIRDFWRFSGEPICPCPPNNTSSFATGLKSTTPPRVSKKK
jgi:hypothetical protein